MKSINMAMAIVVIQLLMLAFMSATGNQGSVNAQKTWCVAKPSSRADELLGNINYACSEVECGIINKGGSCFIPDTMINHASVVMNLYYQSKGRNYWNCDFTKSALTVTTDPSYGSCTYA